MMRFKRRLLVLASLLLSSHMIHALQQASLPRGTLQQSLRGLQQITSEENDEYLAEEEEIEQELEREEEEELESGRRTSSKSQVKGGDYEDFETDEDQQAEQKSGGEFSQKEEELEQELEEEAQKKELEMEENSLNNKKKGAGVSSKEIAASKKAALDEAALLMNANITENSKANATGKSEATGTTDTTQTGAAETQPYDESLERGLDVHLNSSTQSLADTKQPLKSKSASSSEGSGNDEGDYSELINDEEAERKQETGKGKTKPGSAQAEDGTKTSYLDAIEGLEGNATKVEHGRGSTDTMEENNVKTSNVSVTHEPDEPGNGAGRNSSIMTQGAILGTTIGGMVKDNSSSIAGVVGLLVAGAAGVGVAFAGISLWRRFRDRRATSGSGKGLPRIIEIGALSGRKQKSPSYARVHDKNQDQCGYSGTQWPDTDDGWENTGHQETGAGSSVKHKKAWDWDADW